MSNLGARLAQVREVRRMSQQDLAQRTGLKVQNISRLETGFPPGAFPLFRSTGEKRRMPKLKTPGS